MPGFYLSAQFRVVQFICFYQCYEYHKLFITTCSLLGAELNKIELRNLAYPHLNQNRSYPLTIKDTYVERFEDQASLVEKDVSYFGLLESHCL